MADEKIREFLAEAIAPLATKADLTSLEHRVIITLGGLVTLGTIGVLSAIKYFG